MVLVGNKSDKNKEPVKKYRELGQDCIEYAKKALILGKISDSIEAYEQGIIYLKDSFKKNNSQEDKDLLVSIYLTLGSLYEQQEIFEKAKNCYQEAKYLGESKADQKIKMLVIKASQLNLESREINSFDEDFEGEIRLQKASFCLYTDPLTSKVVKEKQFVKNPVISQSKKSYDPNSIKHTKELATLLTEHPDDEMLQNLAFAVIEVFAQKEIKEYKHIEEVKELAISENEEIVRVLLEQFVQPIKEQVILNINLLNGLTEILRHANPALLKSDDLNQILKVIYEKLNIVHQPGSDVSIISLIVSVANLLAVMSDSNFVGLSREEQYEPIYDSLSKLISPITMVEDIVGLFGDKVTSFHIRHSALYARQALLRIPNDETKLQSVIRRTIKIAQGLNSLNNAFQQKSPSELLGVFKLFKEAFKYQVRQKQWYDELRYAELLIECNHFTAFEEFIKHSVCYKQESMFYGIVKLLKKTIKQHSDSEVKCNSLKLLAQIWQAYGCLEVQYDKALTRLLKFNNDYTSSQDGEYIGRHDEIQKWVAKIFLDSLRDSDESLRCTAKSKLKEIEQSLSSFQSMIFDDIIPKNYYTLELEIISHKSIEEDYKELLDIAQKKWEKEIKEGISQISDRLRRRFSVTYIQNAVEQKLLNLKEIILSDKVLNDELKTYIPVNGSYQRFTNQVTNTFDLAKKMQELIQESDKKVFLILGSAGAGKSTFNRYLEKNLWEQYKEGYYIPIFISLPSLMNPETQLIQEYLQNLPPNCSFNEQEINILQSKYKFIFILDGYDEINKLSNLYLRNHLDNWHAKIVISCRTDYLTSMANNDTKIFMPYIGNKPQYQYFIEMSVVPFSEEQVMEYINKYLIVHKDNPDKYLAWKDPKEYERQIEKIPGLKELIKTPFLLMVAMEVIPNVVEKYAKLEEKERINITRTSLIDEFVQQLFDREEDKLMIEGRLPDDGTDVKEDFWAFAMELAVAMHELAINEVYYVQQSSDLFTKHDESSNIWVRFFGIPEDRKKADRLIRARNGCNCVLRTIGKNRRSFIHSTLQDYFVVRKIEMDEEKDAKLSSKTLAPFYKTSKNEECEQKTSTSHLSELLVSPKARLG